MSTAATVAGVLALVLIVLFLLLRNIGNRYKEADWGKPWLNTLDGINRWYCKRYHRLHGDEIKLPESGGVIVAGNHLSGIDPLLMIASCKRPLRFVVAKEEHDRWFLRWLFVQIKLIPVDRKQRPDKAFYAARRALDEGEVVAIFPQGGIDISPKPVKPLKRGVIILARLAGAPVVTTRLEGIPGKGHVFKPLFVRSNARLSVGPAIDVTRDNGDEALAQIELSIYAPQT